MNGSRELTGSINLPAKPHPCLRQGHLVMLLSITSPLIMPVVAHPHRFWEFYWPSDMVVTRSTTREAGRTVKAAPTKGTRKTKLTTIPHWSHAPSRSTIIWLIVSIPSIVWNIGYVLGRPHTMLGGRWHEPIWVPYGVYSRIDLVYGEKGLEENNGYLAGQSIMNIIESLMYISYLLIIVLYARRYSGPQRELRGRSAGLALSLGFGASLMTLSKAMLYGKYVNDMSVYILMGK